MHKILQVKKIKIENRKMTMKLIVYVCVSIESRLLTGIIVYWRNLCEFWVVTNVKCTEYAMLRI